MYNAFECSVAVSTDYSIREYLSIFMELGSYHLIYIMVALCWHSTPAYYASIFDTGLV